MRNRHALLVVSLALPFVPLSQPLAAQGFNFSAAVVVDGREILVSQPENPYSPGYVYRYRQEPKGWRLLSKLSADSASDQDGFGRSLALDGNTLLVASTVADSGRGVVYVFRRDRRAGWRQVDRLSAPDAEPGDGFGRHLLLLHDRAVVASSRDHGAGAVYVFHRGSDGSWTGETTLTPSDSEPRNWFGASLAGTDDRLFVGAAQFRTRGDTASGSVYVYERDTDGGWKQTGRITPGRNGSRSGFGLALLAQGDTLLIGAPGHDAGVGAVFRFSRDSMGAWTDAGRLLPFDADPPTMFGASLALAGRELLVGAPGADHYSGAVYRFTREGTGWGAATRMLVPGLDPDSRTLVGMTVGAGPGAAVIGIPGQDFYQGGAALLARKAGGWGPAHLVAGEIEGLEALTGRKRDCSAGKVGRFDCHQVDLLSFLPIKDIGGGRGVELSDIWGYSDPVTGHEFALVGRVDGTAFVDITDASHPVYVGQLPRTAESPPSSWRDIKTYQHYAFIVSDAAREHGMQVFDLNKLRHPGRMPVTFTEDAHYSRIHSAHNIVVDTSTGYAYIVGSSGGGEMCGGGLHMVDIHDPLHPSFAGCFSDPATGRAGTGYTHDAQCVVYHGPQPKYQGREICFNFNETALEIADVTDKSHPVALSHQDYPNVGYAHQGWLTGDQKYLYEDDELDEIEGLVEGTRTLIWDVSDLDNPVLAGEYRSQDRSSDHNLFVVGDTVYQANYRSGLRVLSIADRLHPTQIGYFDTMPVGLDDPGFEGAWGNYPFFKSGVVAVSSIGEGLFVLKTHSNEVLP